MVGWTGKLDRMVGWILKNCMDQKNNGGIDKTNRQIPKWKIEWI